MRSNLFCWCNILEAVKQSGKTTISITELVSAHAGRTKKKQKERPLASITIIDRIVKETAATYRAEATLEYEFGTPALINEENSTSIVAKAVEKIRGSQALAKLGPIMGAEDFAEYLDRIPGAIAFLGVRNPALNANYPQHHPQYNIDETALSLGAGLYAQVAVDMLK